MMLWWRKLNFSHMFVISTIVQVKRLEQFELDLALHLYVVVNNKHAHAVFTPDSASKKFTPITSTTMELLQTHTRRWHTTCRRQDNDYVTRECDAFHSVEGVARELAQACDTQNGSAGPVSQQRVVVENNRWWRQVERRGGSWTLLERWGGSWTLLERWGGSWTLLERWGGSWTLLERWGGSWTLLERWGGSWTLSL